MSCCDDEIIVETTVDEIIITEGAAVGVTPTDVDNAIATAIDAITPIWEQSPVAEAVYDASSTTDDPEGGFFSTFSAAYLALAALRDTGHHTRLVVELSGTPLVDDYGSPYDFSGMAIWSQSPDTLLAIEDSATAIEPPLRSHNIVWSAETGSSRTAPFLGTRTTNGRTELTGQGGIYTLFRDPGAVPFWVQQNNGVYVIASSADQSFYGLGEDLFGLGANGRLEVVLRAQETWSRDSVTGTGALYRITRDRGTTLVGSVNVGVVPLIELRYGDATTDDLPEGATNLYFTDARADARADERIEAARESSWIALASQWQAAPTLAGTIALGDVYTYTYDDGASGTTTRYRLVPSTYSPTTDAFYKGFDGTNLTELVTTRAMEVTP